LCAGKKDEAMPGTTMQDRQAAEALGDAADRDLVLLAREDPSGPPFRTLYERHRGEVFRFILRLVSDHAQAEDLLQETFLRIYEHLDRYDAERAFRPWLFQIARNTALNGLRARRKKERAASDTLERPGSDRLLLAAATGEAVLNARAALATLSDEDRALLVQRVGLGMKLAELSESLDCTERTVRNRLDAAVDRLTRALGGPKGGAS
jgi:RNA polymerase sigma-70 factor (ECF subfamily)